MDESMPGNVDMLEICSGCRLMSALPYHLLLLLYHSLWVALKCASPACFDQLRYGRKVYREGIRI